MPLVLRNRTTKTCRRVKRPLARCPRSRFPRSKTVAPVYFGWMWLWLSQCAQRAWSTGYWPHRRSISLPERDWTEACHPRCCCCYCAGPRRRAMIPPARPGIWIESDNAVDVVVVAVVSLRWWRRTTTHVADGPWKVAHDDDAAVDIVVVDVVVQTNPQQKTDRADHCSFPFFSVLFDVVVNVVLWLEASLWEAKIEEVFLHQNDSQ